MSYFSKLCISSILILFISYYFRNNLFHIFYTTKVKSNNLFTQSELSQFNGRENQPLYLAILGEIFDVSKGRKHYEPGGPYNVFVGRDASRLFITGEFSNVENADAVLDFTCKDLLAIRDWSMKYHKMYEFKGKLIGKYYNDEGVETPYKRVFSEKVISCESSEMREQDENKKYPPCNMEWKPETGTRVWCSKKSGGIERNWVGVPRLKFSISNEEKQCVCMNPDEQHGENLFKEYENCDPKSVSCFHKS